MTRIPPEALIEAAIEEAHIALAPRLGPGNLRHWITEAAVRAAASLLIAHAARLAVLSDPNQDRINQAFDDGTEYGREQAAQAIIRGTEFWCLDGGGRHKVDMCIQYARGDQP